MNSTMQVLTLGVDIGELYRILNSTSKITLQIECQPNTMISVGLDNYSERCEMFNCYFVYDKTSMIDRGCLKVVLSENYLKDDSINVYFCLSTGCPKKASDF